MIVTSTTKLSNFSITSTSITGISNIVIIALNITFLLWSFILLYTTVHITIDKIFIKIFVRFI